MRLVRQADQRYGDAARESYDPIPGLEEQQPLELIAVIRKRQCKKAGQDSITGVY